MSTIFDAALQGATVTVSTQLGGPVSFDLSGATSGPPNPLVAWLKPSVTFTRDGLTLYKLEPYGAPSPPEYWALLALVLGVLLVFLVWRRGRI